MKSDVARKPTRGTKAATESSGFVQVSLVASTTVSNGQELANLVWKYLGELISETLAEVQQSLATEQADGISWQGIEKRKENQSDNH
jgi:hypothetical protein